MATLRQVFKKYGARCYYCDLWAETVDHYVPVSLGGSNQLKNLRPACRVDNNLKADMKPHDWWRFIATEEYRDKREKLLEKIGNKKPTVKEISSRRIRSSGRRSRKLPAEEESTVGYLNDLIEYARKRDIQLEIERERAKEEKYAKWQDNNRRISEQARRLRAEKRNAS